MCDINIVLSIVTANPQNREQYVLSNSNEKIVFPSFIINDCSNLDKSIYNFINTNLIETLNISDYEKLFLISINSNNITSLINNNSLNILYGLIIPKYQTTNNCYWYNFSFNNLSIPNELSIIGETIRRGF